MYSAPKFDSFVMGGFDCAYPLAAQNKRLDTLATTCHDQLCSEDYHLLRDLAIYTVREGMAWHQIDRGNGKYDFSRFETMMKIGQQERVQQIWDLSHYDYPDDLDPFSAEFVSRFATYAQRAAALLRKYDSRTIYICPQNGMSFFSYMGAEVGTWAPYQKNRGLEFKKQLVRASIAAMEAIWQNDRNVRFIQADPIFYRTSKKPVTKEKTQLAREFIESKFQTWDMLAGKIFPEIGGHPRYLDILGCTYYYHNQEWILGHDEAGAPLYETIPLYSKHRVTIGTLLKQVHQRYKRPMMITETGSWGEMRPKWWRKILRELDKARKRLPIYGVCAYPVIDRPDWVRSDFTHSGLWDLDPADPCRRVPHPETIKFIKSYVTKEKPEEVKPLLHQL